MNKAKAFSVTRSSTKQQLPNIYKNTPRNTVNTESKSYLGQISKEISGNVEYDQMDSKNLTKQQIKLKNILKKMNDDTVQIISNFTPRPKRVQIHHRTASAILAVNEQEVQNNNKIMSRCKFQIQKLMQRSEELNGRNRQFYDQQIIKISEQILAMEEENRNLRFQNQKRGKLIMNEERIIQQGQLKKLETNVYLVELKAKNLRQQDSRVNDQMKLYEKKLKQISQKWIEADRYLKQVQKQTREKKDFKNNESELIQKKTQLQSSKKKSQFYIQNSQYKYYSLLRQLDDCNRAVKEAQDKTDKCFITIQASKMIISKFQSQFKVIKQKKREREQQLNEFLSKSKNNKMGKPDEQVGELSNLGGETGEMPSQIQIKQQLGGENSQLQLEQAINDQNKSGRKKTQQSKQSNKSRIKSVNQNKMEQQNVQHRQDIKLMTKFDML